MTYYSVKLPSTISGWTKWKPTFKVSTEILFQTEMLQIFKAIPTVLKFELLNRTALLHHLKCCMNALPGEKSILKAIKCGVKNVFL